MLQYLYYGYMAYCTYRYVGVARAGYAVVRSGLAVAYSAGAAYKWLAGSGKEDRELEPIEMDWVLFEPGKGAQSVLVDNGDTGVALAANLS